MATAALDNTWKLWSTATNEVRDDYSYRLVYTSHDNVSHSDDVTSVAFTPDGKYLISGSEDATMRVEDLMHHIEEQPSSLHQSKFESDSKMAIDHPDMDWSKESNAILAINTTPKRIVEPRWNHDEGRNIVHVAAVHGKYDFLKAALLIEDDGTADLVIRDDTGDIVGHRTTAWEGRQKLAFFAALSKDGRGKTPLALACENESSPTVKVLLDCYSKLLGQQYANPFYKRDKSYEEHPSEDFPLDDFCVVMKKFPHAGIDFVKSLKLVQHHDSNVQRGVSRFDIRKEMLVKGSPSRVPYNFWRAFQPKEQREGKGPSDGSTSTKRRKGNPVTAKMVPIKGIAGPTSQFLEMLVRASLRNDDYTAFDNEVVKAVIQHKWEAFVKKRFWRHRILYFFLLISLTVDALLNKSYKNATPENRPVWTMRIATGTTLLLWMFFQGVEVRQVFSSSLNSFGEDENGNKKMKWGRILRFIPKHYPNIYMPAGYAAYLNDFWNGIDILSLTLIGLTYGSRGLEFFSLVDTGQQNVDRSAILMSFALPLTYLNTLYFIQGLKESGQVVRMILGITKNIKLFLLIAFVCMIGFAVGFFILMGDASNAKIMGQDNNFMMNVFSSWSMMFGQFDNFEQNLEGVHDSVQVYSLLLLFFLFSIFFNIIMLNLLIALMGQLFEKIHDAALAEFVFAKASIILEFEAGMKQSPSWYKKQSVKIKENEEWFPLWLQVLVPTESKDKNKKGYPDTLATKLTGIIEKMDKRFTDLEEKFKQNISKLEEMEKRSGQARLFKSGAAQGRKAKPYRLTTSRRRMSQLALTGKKGEVLAVEGGREGGRGNPGKKRGARGGWGAL